MATNYPTSKQTFTDPQATDVLNSPSHAGLHTDMNDTVEAVQDKVGIGSSAPASGKLLKGDGAGSSAWDIDFKDEDDMVSDSNSAVASQQSIKAYVDDNTDGSSVGINVEILSADKTLTVGTDEPYQWLDSDEAYWDITLDTASASVGDKWVIKHNSPYDEGKYMRIMQGVSEMEKVYSQQIKEYIYDGSNWVAASSGTGQSLDYNIGLGFSSSCHSGGVAIGAVTRGENEGAALGFFAKGYNKAVAVGAFAEGHNEGVAVGYYANTNSNHYAVALGEWSECERFSEMAHNIDGSNHYQKNNITIGGWKGETTNDTPTEIYCGGESGERFTIRAQSVLSFKLQVVARDNTSGDCAVYHFSGAIKRDGSSNTALVGNLTEDVIAEEDDSWSVAVTADDTNEALKIEVTGDASNTVQWTARLDGVETHF